MKRLYSILVVFCCLFCTSIGNTEEVSYSLNIEFNDPTEFDSGGNWTIVAKADELGLAGAVLNLDILSLNFDEDTGFLAPSEFEIQMTLEMAGRIEILTADNQLETVTYGVGIIGGNFPSSYVDTPGLTSWGSNPDLGSFTGGVELATGVFDPGNIPAWLNNPSEPNGATVYVGPNDAEFAQVFSTVRYISVPGTMLVQNDIPEPSSIFVLLGLVIPSMLIASKRSRSKR